MIARLIDVLQSALRSAPTPRPRYAGWCSHRPDLASACLTCRGAR